MLAFLSLFILISGGLCAVDHCSQNCTAEQQQICGSDGNTYVNPCYFGISSCQAHESNKILYEIHSGECSTQGVHNQLPACTRICEEDLDPVCGSDNQIYKNKCLFQRAQCQLAAQGKHLGEISTTTTSCPTPRAINCTQYKADVGNLAFETTGLNLIQCQRKSHTHNQYQVCASNNKNYRDECAICHHIESIKAHNNGQTTATNLMILHDGRCKRGVAYNPLGLNLIG
ncbi:hypothetical protein SNE40_005787 [Patella caerulea]|uniref:Kazal-like domain-containing protein n=1 Tax=Patella caerulea TaxID=87958 RepID=A0AAN8K8V0_PATCE